VTRLLSSELLKLRTTRTFYGLVGAELAAVLIIAILSATLSHPHPGEAYLRNLEGFGTFAQIVAALLGILSLTTEFRHGTITPTLLGEPVRPRLVSAKLYATLLASLVLGLLTSGMIAGIVAVFASLRDFDYDATGHQVLGLILGGGAACALFGALGLGLGALVRNQVGAIIGLLVYMLIVEPFAGLIPAGIGDAISKFGLGGSSAALAATDSDRLHQLPGGLVFLGWAVLFMVAGTLVFTRRDVTA
jgi:ABC-2 type transport system permease protein